MFFKPLAHFKKRNTSRKIRIPVFATTNLNVTTYRNGNSIPEVTDGATWASLTTGAWCSYDNDSANDAIYGKLYNWYAVTDPRGLAPTGYYIPNNDEWLEYINSLGGDAIAGGKMKTTGLANWITPNTGATNESGFSGLPGGERSGTGTFPGTFSSIGFSGMFWTITEKQSVPGTAYGWQLNKGYANIFTTGYTKKYGMSVRCAIE
jgi:uncharacterized protein (TIGR02145 family)